MFATARTAAAIPLASPSLKHVFELTHTHSPLVGLGIRTLPLPPSSSAATFASSSIHTGSGQPMMGRPPLARMQSPHMPSAILPRTPRLQCATALPSVFSPLLLTPSGAHAPAAEGYFSNNDASNDIGEEAIASVSSVNSMNMPTSHRRQLYTTANNFHSTFRFAQRTANLTTPEVQRVGLGIAGLTLSSLNPNFGITNVDANDLDTPALDPPEVAPMAMTLVRPIKSVSFNAHARVIGSLKDAGYVADTEHEASLVPRRRQRRHSRSAPSGMRSCKDRVQTPYNAPNGEASWL